MLCCAMAWLKWRKHLIWAPKVFNYFTWHGRQFLIFDFLSPASPPWDWHLIFSPIYHRDVWFGTPSLSEDKEQLNAPARWPSSWWPPPSLIYTEGRRVTLHCHNLKRWEKWPGIFFFWACYVRCEVCDPVNTKYCMSCEGCDCKDCNFTATYKLPKVPSYCIFLSKVI